MIKLQLLILTLNNMETIDELLEHYKIKKIKCNKCLDTGEIFNIEENKMKKCKHEDNSRFRTNKRFKLNT
jgi:hypothetical protein